MGAEEILNNFVFLLALIIFLESAHDHWCLACWGFFLDKIRKWETFYSAVFRLTTHLVTGNGWRVHFLIPLLDLYLLQKDNKCT
jgi:hypothetical protein